MGKKNYHSKSINFSRIKYKFLPFRKIKLSFRKPSALSELASASGEPRVDRLRLSFLNRTIGLSRNKKKEKKKKPLTGKMTDGLSEAYGVMSLSTFIDIENIFRDYYIYRIT